jgi:hypothetical protein
MASLHSVRGKNVILTQKHFAVIQGDILIEKSHFLTAQNNFYMVLEKYTQAKKSFNWMQNDL